MSTRPDAERGAAVVDFVLVLVVLVPLFLGVLQLALVVFVRTTVTAAASDGARYGATLGHGPADGVERTRHQLSGVLAGRYSRDVAAREVTVDGLPALEVTVRVVVPALGVGGPGVSLEVSGHAIEEQP